MSYNDIVLHVAMNEFIGVGILVLRLCCCSHVSNGCHLMLTSGQHTTKQLGVYYARLLFLWLSSEMWRAAMA